MNLTHGNLLTIQPGKKKEALKWVLVLCPIIIYFIAVMVYGLNYPYEDDFNAILEFLNNYENAKGFAKLRMLFLQHNEHRILSSRIVYVVYNYLPGQINLKTIIYIGNAQHAGAFFVFLYFIRQAFKERWFLPALISSLCFFDLANWENAYWAMASVGNYSVLLLFLLSLYFYSKEGAANLTAAVVFQGIATYSLGNGIFACCFVFLYNILNFDKKKAITSGISCAVFVLFYFLNYHFAATTRSPLKVDKALIFFLRMLAGHTDLYYSNSALPMVIGGFILMLITLVTLSVKKYRLNKEQIFFLTVLGFCTASCVMISSFRSSIREFPSSRYMLYSHTIWAMLFIFMAFRQRLKGNFRIIAFITTTIFVVNYAANIRVGVLNFEDSRNWILGDEIRYSYPDSARAIWNKSCELNIYCIPPDHGK